jgi:hypothetical protein
MAPHTPTEQSEEVRLYSSVLMRKVMTRNKQ